MIEKNSENISTSELQQIHNTSVNEIKKARQTLKAEIEALDNLNIEALGLDDSDKESIKQDLVSDFRERCKFFVKLDMDAKKMHLDLLESNKQRVR